MFFLLYWLIKLENKNAKKRQFVKRDGTGNEIWLLSYIWVNDENTNKAFPGLLVRYFDKEDNRNITIAVRQDYFFSKYISLKEKEKEDKIDSRN